MAQSIWPSDRSMPQTRLQSTASSQPSTAAPFRGTHPFAEGSGGIYQREYGAVERYADVYRPFNVDPRFVKGIQDGPSGAIACIRTRSAAGATELGINFWEATMKACADTGEGDTAVSLGEENKRASVKTFSTGVAASRGGQYTGSSSFGTIVESDYGQTPLMQLTRYVIIRCKAGTPVGLVAQRQDPSPEESQQTSSRATVLTSFPTQDAITSPSAGGSPMTTTPATGSRLAAQFPCVTSVQPAPSEGEGGQRPTVAAMQSDVSTVRVNEGTVSVAHQRAALSSVLEGWASCIPIDVLRQLDAEYDLKIAPRVQSSSSGVTVQPFDVVGATGREPLAETEHLPFLVVSFTQKPSKASRVPVPLYHGMVVAAIAGNVACFALLFRDAFPETRALGRALGATPSYVKALTSLRHALSAACLAGNLDILVFVYRELFVTSQFGTEDARALFVALMSAGSVSDILKFTLQNRGPSRASPLGGTSPYPDFYAPGSYFSPDDTNGDPLRRGATHYAMMMGRESFIVEVCRLLTQENIPAVAAAATAETAAATTARVCRPRERADPSQATSEELSTMPAALPTQPQAAAAAPTPADMRTIVRTQSKSNRHCLELLTAEDVNGLNPLATGLCFKRRSVLSAITQLRPVRYDHLGQHLSSFVDEEAVPGFTNAGAATTLAEAAEAAPAFIPGTNYAFCCQSPKSKDTELLQAAPCLADYFPNVIKYWDTKARPWLTFAAEVGDFVAVVTLLQAYRNAGLDDGVIATIADKALWAAARGDRIEAMAAIVFYGEKRLRIPLKDLIDLPTRVVVYKKFVLNAPSFAKFVAEHLGWPVPTTEQYRAHYCGMDIVDVSASNPQAGEILEEAHSEKKRPPPSLQGSTKGLSDKAVIGEAVASLGRPPQRHSDATATQSHIVAANATPVEARNAELALLKDKPTERVRGLNDMRPSDKVRSPSAVGAKTSKKRSLLQKLREVVRNF